MKFNILDSDPAWSASDKLTMSDVKRGAEAQYQGVLNDQEIIDLDVPSITADDAVLALWCPSWKIDVGLKCIEKWGFRYTQTWIWVKTKIDPFKDLKKSIKKDLKDLEQLDVKATISIIENHLNSFDLNDLLSFNMGRLFRQTHEVVLLGVKGKAYSYLQNKSQRSVSFHAPVKVLTKDGVTHSAKPEILQDRLELMFPTFKNKVEMFARRDRDNWYCVGNECPSSLGEDIKDSIIRLSKL